MAEGTEKKVNIGDAFKNIGTGLVRFFREIKAEVKKVIWPTVTQLKNNTLIVITSIIIIGIFIWVVGFFFNYIVNRVVGQ